MFVIATIQIPIEIHENGESIPMMDRSHIEVTPCDELPPIQDNPSQLIMEKFAEILATTKKQKEPIPEILHDDTQEKIQPMISPDELFTKKRGQSITFKHVTKNRHTHRITAKNLSDS